MIYTLEQVQLSYRVIEAFLGCSRLGLSPMQSRIKVGACIAHIVQDERTVLVTNEIKFVEKNLVCKSSQNYFQILNWEYAF